MKSFFTKWWIYQKERFPISQYLPMIAAFSFCAVSYSATLRGSSLSWPAFFVALITSLGFFMLLRVADEFKDFEEDSLYRPYRPVPRGLITLRELAIAGILLLFIQLLLAYLYNPNLLPLLLIALFYFALMSKEFFVPQWLKSHVVVYIWSHMLIMPLIDFYATACDWYGKDSGQQNTSNLAWFLIASFFNGAVIEFGRKIRSKEEEEEGVETYTFLWGNKIAVGVWIGSIALSLFTAVMAAWQIDLLPLVVILLSSIFMGCMMVSIRFVKTPSSSNAKIFEKMSGVWTFSMYLSLGLLPILFAT